MNDEEQLEHKATPPTPEELAADKAKYGTLTEAEIDSHDEKSRLAFEAQMPDLLAAKKRELAADDDDPGDPPAGSDAARELIRDAIRQGN